MVVNAQTAPHDGSMIIAHLMPAENHVEPRYTDTHKYPHGYKPACDTNIGRTFERIRRERMAGHALTRQKVEQTMPRVTARAA